MTLKTTLIWTAVLGLVLPAVQVFAGEPVALKTQTDKESYAAGVNIVRTLTQQGGEINLDVVIKGLKDGLSGDKLLMTEDDLLRTIAGLKMTRTQDQAANKRSDSKIDAAGKETEDAAGVRQKQERPEQLNEQESGQLASREPAGGITTMANAGGGNSSDAQQGQAAMNRQNEPAAPLSPNGTVISKRNQARLSVMELKAAMRARAISGGDDAK